LQIIYFNWQTAFLKSINKIIISINAFFIISILLFSCATGSSNIVELETKGTAFGISTPDWVKLYLDGGVSALQALPEFKDKYCIVGEETGVNRQFVLAWADQASAQQRIGSLIRTNIASRYQAAVTGQSQSGAQNEAVYQQEIDIVLSAIVNVSFSGAQREADWWSLRRRYDTDNKEIYTDEYTAFVLYTIPRAELNRQVALAMETSLSKDSVLYDITIALARDIFLQGYDTNERQSAAFIQQTASSYYNPPGTLTALALDEISLIDEYVLGREVAASILSNYTLYDINSPLTAYINRILSALVINSPKPAAYNGYTAVILDSGQINAFASPGGHIFITLGLIKAAGTEEALAAVLAHELAHIQLRHGMRAIKSDRDIQDWMSQFFFSGVSIIADSHNAGFSLIQEFDADIGALSLLSAAGYNLQGLIDMLTTLENIQSSIQGGFNTTHPSPASRLVNVRIAAGRYQNTADNSRYRQSRFNQIFHGL